MKPVYPTESIFSSIEEVKKSKLMRKCKYFSSFLSSFCFKLFYFFKEKRGLWKFLLLTKSNKILQFSSVAQPCPTLCDPMNHSTPGLPVHHQLPEFTQTHVHQVGDAIQPSHPLSSPSPPAPNPSQHQSLFQWVSSYLVINLPENRKAVWVIITFYLRLIKIMCLHM